MTVRTIECKFCDLCDAQEGSGIVLHSFHKKHICESCFEALYFDYLRIFKSQVPDRRGGMRQLGEYDS
jgi:hypothetical protein